MPYYTTGDYYGRGDYYQGDGILSSIGGFVKGALGGALKSVFPIPAAVLKAVTSGASMPTSPATVAANFPTPASAIAGLLPSFNMAGMPPTITPPVITQSPLGTPVSPMAIMRQELAAMMKGYRPNKSTYVVRGGGTSRWGPAGMIRLIAKGTVPVKNRRMNVANPRALRRGLRRAAGFVKLARRAHVRLAAFTGRGKSKRKK